MEPLENWKHEMYNSLKRDGTLNEIKAQLRRNLVKKLTGNQVHKVEQKSIFEKIVASLFVDYLEFAGFDHSLSVFVPEFGLPAFSRENILEAMRFEKESTLYRKMTLPSTDSLKEFEQPLAMQLMEELYVQLGRKNIDSCTQTSTSYLDHRAKLDEQLKKVEDKYLQWTAKNRLAPNRSIEERMLAYQRQCDADAQRTIQAENERYCQEMAEEIRAQEERKFNLSLQNVKTQLREELDAKIVHYKDLEQRVELDYAKRKTILESNLYAQRQKLIDEMDDMSRRDADNRRKTAQENENQLRQESNLYAWEARIAQEENKLHQFKTQLEMNSKTKIEEAIQAYKDSYAEREANLQLERDKVADLQLELTIQEKDDKIRLAQANKAITENENVQSDFQRLKVSFRQAEDTSKELLENKVHLESQCNELKRCLQQEQENAQHLQSMVTSNELELKIAKETAQAAQREQARMTALYNSMQEEIHEIKIKNRDGGHLKELTAALDKERSVYIAKEGSWWEERRSLQGELVELSNRVKRSELLLEDEQILSENLRHEIISLNDMLSQAQTAMKTLDLGSHSKKHQRNSNHAANEEQISNNRLLTQAVATMKLELENAKATIADFQHREEMQQKATQDTKATNAEQDAKVQQQLESMERKYEQRMETLIEEHRTSQRKVERLREDEEEKRIDSEKRSRKENQELRDQIFSLERLRRQHDVEEAEHHRIAERKRQLEREQHEQELLLKESQVQKLRESSSFTASPLIERLENASPAIVQPSETISVSFDTFKNSRIEAPSASTTTTLKSDSSKTNAPALEKDAIRIETNSSPNEFAVEQAQGDTSICKDDIDSKSPAQVSCSSNENSQDIAVSTNLDANLSNHVDTSDKQLDVHTHSKSVKRLTNEDVIKPNENTEIAGFASEQETLAQFAVADSVDEKIMEDQDTKTFDEEEEKEDPDMCMINEYRQRALARRDKLGTSPSRGLTLDDSDEEVVIHELESSDASSGMSAPDDQSDESFL